MKIRLVSFNIETLFPNIPVDRLLKLVEKQLITISIQKTDVQDPVKLTGLCIELNYFSLFDSGVLMYLYISFGPECPHKVSVHTFEVNINIK